jgi:thiol-disulfide isomerase/thioredoxin
MNEGVNGAARKNMRNLCRHTVLLGLLVLLTTPLASAQGQEIPLGIAMPMADRTMQTVDEGQVTLAGLAGSRGTVVAFWSNDCVWIDRYEGRFTELASEFGPQGISFVLVNANDPVAFPRESAAAGRQQGYPIPYAIDQGSVLARAFGAARTPHVFVFDANRILVYSGTIDDSPGDPGNVGRTYLRDALQAVVGPGPVALPQTRAFGCTIRLQSP